MKVPPLGFGSCKNKVCFMCAFKRTVEIEGVNTSGFNQNMFRLLCFLKNRESCFITSDEIYVHVWNQKLIQGSRLVNLVYKLRKELKDTKWAIGSLRGKGYYLYEKESFNEENST